MTILLAFAHAMARNDKFEPVFLYALTFAVDMSIIEAISRAIR